MKKQLFFLAASFLSAAYALHAGPVDANKAIDIAKNFFAQKVESDPSMRSSASLTIEYTGGKSTAMRAASQNLYYVINRGNDQGFVIVSGDDRVPEILGYSDQGAIKSEDIAQHPAFAGFFSEWDRQMEYAIANLPDKSYDAAAMSSLRAENFPKVVKPLLMSHKDGHIAWDQSHPFNYYSPKVTYKGKVYPTVAGCVATGMATVMRWHRWPQKPVGKTSYKWVCKVGSSVLKESVISRDYDKESKAYDWNLMTARPSSNIADANAREIGRLLYDVGVAVKMQFGPGFSGGSGTYIEYCAPSLIEHFDYKSTAKFLLRSKYTKAQWINLVKKELQHSPIIYGGISKGGGHCFVIDGYDEKDYVHVDWGWSAMSNGYFLIDILDPGSQGTGGGSGGFQHSQQMVADLYPNKANTEDPTDDAGDDPTDDAEEDEPTTDVQLSVSAAPTASVKSAYVYKTVDFRINKMKNAGKNEFTGKIGLAIRDSRGKLTLLKAINVNRLAPYTTLPQTYSANLRRIYFNSYPAGSYLIVPIYSVVVDGADKWFYFETGTTNATLGATIRNNFVSFYSAVATTINGMPILDADEMKSAQSIATDPTVYPTVANQEINILVPKGFDRAIIFDAAGLRVGDYNLTEGLNTIDVSSLAPANYIIKVSGADQDKAIRFVKK